MTSIYDDLKNKLINYIKENKGTVFVAILILVIIINRDDPLPVLFSPAMIMFIISCIYIMYTKRIAKVKISKDLDFSKSPRTLPSYNTIDYWRGIPCKKILKKHIGYYIITQK